MRAPTLALALSAALAAPAAAQDDLVPLALPDEPQEAVLAPVSVLGQDSGRQCPAAAAEPMIEVSPRPRRLDGNAEAGLAQFASWLLPAPRPKAADLSLPADKDNTDSRRNWRYLCEKNPRYACSTDSQGRSVLVLPDGTRYTHLSYDQSLRLGQRNRILVQPGQRSSASLHWRTLTAAAAMEAGASARDYVITASPLVFDLKGVGVRASDRILRFDLDGGGRMQRLHDIASTCGMLVFDADGDGIAGEHGRELFGTATDLDGDGKPDGYADGFVALEAFVLRAEREEVLAPGTLARGRLGAGDLARLGRSYGLGLRVGGFLKKTVSLEEAGVREVALSQAPSVRAANFDGQGDDVVRRQGARFARADGSSGAYEDIFFAAVPERLQPAVAFAGRSAP